MAHTNNTPKLQLAQFVGTDKPTWLGDWNSTMLTIDNAVGTLQEETSSVVGLVETLSGDVGTLTNEVNEVKPSNVGVNGDVLTKTESNTQEWKTLNASTINATNGTIQDNLDELNDKVNDMGSMLSNQSASVNIASAESKSVASITLTPGVWVVNAFANFPHNTTGYRSIGISETENNLGYWSGGRVNITPTPTIATMINTTRFIQVNQPTTLYCTLSHNAGTTLACYGRIEAMKIN